MPFCQAWLYGLPKYPWLPTGTFAGVIEKLDYLEQLGVNAVELLPVHEFNELEYFQASHAEYAFCVL